MTSALAKLAKIGSQGPQSAMGTGKTRNGVRRSLDIDAVVGDDDSSVWHQKVEESEQLSSTLWHADSLPHL